MKEYNKALSLLHTVYRAANSTLTAQNFAKSLLRIVKSQFSASHCSLSYCHKNSLSIYHKITLSPQNKYRLRQGNINILQKEEREAWEKEKTTTAKRKIILPLIFIDNMGVLSIHRSPKAKFFAEKERKLSSVMGEEIAIILRNFQLYEENRKTILTSIRTITKMLRNYAPSSRIHVEYLYKIIKEMRQALNLTENQSNALRYAFLLHDAGKIEIPQKILSKHAPLTPQEKEAIKRHPQIGAKLLKDFSILRPVLPIILYHHERYDGTGYPSGLKKDEIPLEARIMAIMDAFDAMLFGRHYKRKMKLKEIIEKLKAQSGKQFDPQIITKFIEVLNKKEIRKYLKDISKRKRWKKSK